MISDFVAIKHHLDGRDIRVYALADCHIGAKECAIDKLRSFLNKVLADPDAYVVIAGDVLDNGIKSSVTNVYEEVLTPNQQLELAIELFTPLAEAGKILAITDGNHENRTSREVGVDLLYTMACVLRCQDVYRKNMAFVRIELSRGNIKHWYTILVTHGKSKNKTKQFGYALEGVDALITGHTHEGIAQKNGRLCVSPNGIVSVKTLVNLTTESFLEYGGYGASAMYLPTENCNPAHLLLEWSNTMRHNGTIKVVW